MFNSMDVLNFHGNILLFISVLQPLLIRVVSDREVPEMCAGLDLFP